MADCEAVVLFSCGYYKLLYNFCNFLKRVRFSSNEDYFAFVLDTICNISANSSYCSVDYDFYFHLFFRAY